MPEASEHRQRGSAFPTQGEVDQAKDDPDYCFDSIPITVLYRTFGRVWVGEREIGAWVRSRRRFQIFAWLCMKAYMDEKNTFQLLSAIGDEAHMFVKKLWEDLRGAYPEWPDKTEKYLIRKGPKSVRLAVKPSCLTFDLATYVPLGVERGIRLYRKAKHSAATGSGQAILAVMNRKRADTAYERGRRELSFLRSFLKGQGKQWEPYDEDEETDWNEFCRLVT